MTITRTLSDLENQLRALAEQLVADNDDSPDEAAEQGTRLARLVLDAVLPALPRDAERVALVACVALVDAYRRGKASGGSVAWSDLDAALDLARQAVLLETRRRRAHRRLQHPG